MPAAAAIPAAIVAAIPTATAAALPEKEREIKTGINADDDEEILQAH